MAFLPISVPLFSASRIILPVEMVGMFRCSADNFRLRAFAGARGAEKNQLHVDTPPYPVGDPRNVGTGGPEAPGRQPSDGTDFPAIGYQEPVLDAYRDTPRGRTGRALLKEALVMPHHHLAFDLLGGFQRHADDDHHRGAAQGQAGIGR